MDTFGRIQKNTELTNKQNKMDVFLFLTETYMKLDIFQSTFIMLMPKLNKYKLACKTTQLTHEKHKFLGENRLALAGNLTVLFDSKLESKGGKPC